MADWKMKTYLEEHHEILRLIEARYKNILPVTLEEIIGNMV
jgi:hypothetical protein